MASVQKSAAAQADRAAARKELERVGYELADGQTCLLDAIARRTALDEQQPGAPAARTAGRRR